MGSIFNPILGWFMFLATDPTIWDGISDFVTDNSPLLTNALLAVFAIPVIFALYKLVKRALGKV